MNNAKHTPGPWTTGMIQLHGYGCNIEYYKRTFNTVPTDPENDLAELEANARLIAAAPELIECLKNMQQYINENPTVRAEVILDVLYNMCTEQIIKATGGAE